MTSFDEMYDHDTVSAIESWRAGQEVEPVCGWRGGVMAAAVVVAGLSGVRSALEDDIEPATFEQRGNELSSGGAVTVLFVPDDPSGTVAVVRPWLLCRPRPGCSGPGRLGPPDHAASTAIPEGVTPAP